MGISSNDLANEITGILVEEGWDEAYADYEQKSFRQLSDGGGYEHVFRLIETDYGILIEEIQGDEVVSEMEVDWDTDLDEVRELVANAGGGIYFG